MYAVMMTIAAVAVIATSSAAFDGRKWNVSTGNISVNFIQASPIGHLAKPGYVMEAPPSVESLIEMKKQGLVANEDYVAWGAVEREPGKWDWTQHDKVYENIKAAGLDYVVYNWTHFPPVWLREGSSTDRTLMRCVEHHENTNYLSIYDPKTIEHYDHFYKGLWEHFGDRIDGVYACILGPYGEGNYPLNVPDFINMGHIHEGYWCQDPYGLTAFRNAMRAKYKDIAALNSAWKTDLINFSSVLPPKEIGEGLKPSLQVFSTAGDRRRWLDFITWYHQALIDFTEESIKVTLKYFPKEKVRTKPGGNAGGVNPIAWGTYCPGYAKMAGPYGIVLQPADCQGACFGDKWVGTAYKFYGVTLSTEPAGGLDKNGFTRRMFSDASCGAKQLFTYEYTAHVPEIQKYIHLYTGEMGDTDVAVLCPTTLYRLGGDLGPTISESAKLRDLTDYDVLDELLITDGALDRGRYSKLVILQGDFIDQPILDRIEKWVRRGGTLVIASGKPVCNVEGDVWSHSASAGTVKLGKGSVACLRAKKENAPAYDELYSQARSLLGADGTFDGVWTTKRGSETLILNQTDKLVMCKVAGKTSEVEVAPHSIVSVR